MMTGLRRLGQNIYAGIATGAVLTLALLLPTATFAENAAKVDATFGVANVTAGDTDYKSSRTAASGQTVKVQLYYVNNESANSGKDAKNVRTKITVPTSGKGRVVKAMVQADGGDAINRQVTVNLDRDDATLQYVPGSAIWKHNTGTADKPKVVESRVSDDIISNAQGTVLGDQKPGKAFAATVTVQMRVGGPGISTSVRSQKQGQSGQWSANNTAKPGDTMRYLISYQNTSKGTHSNVAVRDTLPAGVSLVSGSTTIINRNQQSGVKAGSDSITTHAGIDIGSYTAGANAYVTFDAKLPAADKLACGPNALTNTAVIKLANGDESFATSVTNVTRDCGGATPSPTSPTPSPTPATPSGCDNLTAIKVDGRKVKITMKYTPKDGTKLKTVTYDFGDGSTPLTTDKTTVTHTYDTDGSYTISTRLLLTSNDKDQTVTNGSCSAVVTIGGKGTAQSPTGSTGPTDELPGTGPGEVFGLFAVVATIGTIVHRIYLSRRLNRAGY